MGVGGKLADSPRQLLLILLSQMMASRPFSQAALNVIVRRIRQEESEATAIEAAGHLALIEAYSKVTDCTGKATISGIIQVLLPRLIQLAKFFNGTSRLRRQSTQ